ncbi:tryptophan synthase subunit alpha [Alkalitalea saponilacus]|uniref:Tryptophan synthase alpha chain n=1 Tax=Alkalitalea saponilacus TaxID=889453 RepID=A0A1T5HTJ2_9BACT|nr:tryptophan synthase subunit alpha [Alkalitalea saponilacus]ASB48541.1 tryptophan synthase subunit alpha [Alkalitalea saponilacus]SKC23830.1 tryptophan synthase, alpha chain [Alkalitalea saponilacus]
MNRLNRLFADKKDLLSVYFTAGFPRLEDTVPILKALETSGVDFVEIGMPFSDPLADGPVIQKSSTQALNNGMNLKVLFQQLQNIRNEVSMPIILMGYLNPVLKFGFEPFLDKCSEVGVDGLILPDLPFEMYDEQYRQLFEARDISNTFLITPQTPPERVRLLDENTTGFIYMVSSAAVTGAKTGLNQFQIEYFSRIRDMKLKSPKMVGFGISNKESFNEVCKYANGAIVGSAFIKMLEKSTDLKNDISRFVDELRG